MQKLEIIEVKYKAFQTRIIHMKAERISGIGQDFQYLRKPP